MGKKQNTKSAGKWVTVGVALFLAFVLIVGLCLQVFATNEKFKPSEWFKKDEQTEELPEEGGENAFVQDKKESGIKLMSTQAASGSAYKGSYLLTATVLPEEADNKNVAWSIEWENPASAWATGKNVTDYAKAEIKTTEWIEDENFPNGGYEGTVYKPLSESDGTYKEVLVTVLQAFGEHVVVTVKSQDDETKSATVKFGYVARLDEAKIKMEFLRGNTAVDTVVLGDGEDYYLLPDLEFTVGTVEPSYKGVFKCFFASYGGDYGEGLVDNYGKEYILPSMPFTSTADFYQNCFTRQVSVAEIKEHVAKFDGKICFQISVTVMLTSDVTDNLYKESWTKAIRLKIDTSLLKVGVNDVTVDQSGELYF